MRAPGDCNPRPRNHHLQLRSRSIASEARPQEWERSQESGVLPLGTTSNLATLRTPWLVNGDWLSRVVRGPTAESLCDRMERGEEEASTGRRDASQRNHFCRR